LAARARSKDKWRKDQLWLVAARCSFGNAACMRVPGRPFNPMLCFWCQRCADDRVHEGVSVIQSKTKKPVQFELTENQRAYPKTSYPQIVYRPLVTEIFSA
ncbi:hypothetical protein N9O61_04610, partial [Octadecabacter sp.]|nr:hypothetical protein [Octadecabacter sp.]